MTVNVFLERTFEAPLTADDLVGGSRESAWCFDLYRVQWHGSFLSQDGRALVCRFSSPDLESARLALRASGADLERFWLGNVAGAGSPGAANVVVARSFAAPTRIEDVSAREKAKAWCLETHRVVYSHSYFSLDGTRMLCFYAAPDAEAVRAAQREADMPHDAVWAGALVTPVAPGATA